MSAALLAKLVEVGTPATLVAEVAMELARAEAELDVLERRRKSERERKARSRAVTGQGVTSEESAEQGSPEVSPPAPPLPNPSNSAPLSPPKIEEEKRAAIGSCLRKAYPPPGGVTDEQWDAFRKQRKKALNQRSYALLVNKLVKLSVEGHDPGEMIDLAIERGWETVFAPKEFGPPKPKYVSASGYEYRGDVNSVIREAERRHDMATYWRAKSDREAQSVGNVAGQILKRVGGRA